MSLFSNKPLFLTRYSRVEFTKNIKDLISNGDYSAAAENLVISKYPFNETIRMLSNCPKALSSYLYKSASVVGITPSVQQVICHLFLEVELSILSFIPSTEKQSDLNRLKSFIKDFKSSLHPDTVINMISKAGETSLLTEAAVIFEKYETAIKYFLLCNDFSSILEFITQIPPEKQRPVLIRFLKTSKSQLIAKIDDGLKVTAEAIFDTLVPLVLQAGVTKQLQDLVKSFSNLYDMNIFTNKIHHTLYYLMFIITNDPKSAKALEAKERFDNLDHDFIVQYLTDHNLFNWAAKHYACTKERHILAVKYAFKSSISDASALMKDDLKDAHDLHDCWLELFDLYHKAGDSITTENWVALIKQATTNAKKTNLSLDDIFSYIPASMKLDDVQMTIARSVDQSSKAIKNSESLREQIKERMVEIRKLFNESGIKSINIDPNDKLCCICGQQACDAPFAAYPCGHAVHMSCFLTNLNNYVDSTTSLEIFNYLANLKEDYGKVAEIITKSCPACGMSSLIILDRPFIEEGESEMAKWEIPE